MSLMLMVGSVSATINSIEVISPNGGEYLSGTQDITWNWEGGETGDLVNIVFSTNDFDTQSVIATDVAFDSSPFEWNTIEFEDGSNYKIRFIDDSQLVYDTSDELFTIDNTYPTIEIYTIDNPVFSPNGDGVLDEVTIDLKFSEEVDWSIEISDESGVVYSWTGLSTNPNSRTWDGTDNTGEKVYTVKITATDEAGNQIVDESKTITLDTTGPTVTLDQISSDEWMVDKDGLIINAVCDETDCIGKKLYVSDTDDNCDTYGYENYENSPQTLISGKWICAAAKDNLNNIGYSEPQYFRVSTTIQDAIDFAVEGDIINVAEGIYPESIVIGKSLTLIAIGEKPIIKGLSENYIIKVEANNVMIDNFEVNGEGIKVGDNTFLYGIWVSNADNIEIKDSIVRNVWAVTGNGIQVDNSIDSNIHGNIISSFHKRGIRYIDSEGIFHNNEVIGDNIDGINRVQNLVNLWGGSNIEIYNNLLHNALTNPEDTPEWDSPGIFISSYGGSGNSYANIHDNEIYDCDSGIVIGSVYATTDGSSAVITNNNLHDLELGINFEVIRLSDDGQNTVSAVINYNEFTNNALSVKAVETTSMINATFNWWGDLIPSDDVEGNVDYTSFAEDSSLTRFYAPVLESIGNKEVHEGSTLIISLIASDADEEDILTYSDNVDFGSLVGTEFTWTPTGADSETNQITFTVSDGDLEVSETMTVTVNNVAPEVEAGEDQTVNEGEEVSFTGSATDVGNDELTYSWDFGDTETSDVQNPTHIYADDGIYTVTLTVSDDSTSISDTLIVTVNNVAPEVEAGEDQTVNEGEEVSFTGSATDVGNDELTYSWDFGDTETSDVQNPTHIYADDGIYTVTLTVSDDDGGVSSEELTVTVVDFIIELQEGWNLISIPVVPKSTAIGDVLGDADVSAVYTYEPLNPEADNGWLSFSGESGSLETMTAGYGYWVYADSETAIKGNGELISEEPITPPSRNLVAGWNLIGHYGLEEKSIDDALYSLVNKASESETWSAIWPSLLGETKMEPKQGYWLAIDGSLTIYTPGI